MAYQVTEIVRDGFPEGGAMLLVMLVLSTRANYPDGNSIHPSVRTIARETHLTIDYVRDILKRLVEDGWLIVVERGKGGAPSCTTRYAMNVQRLEALALSTTGKPYPWQQDGERGGTQSGEGGHSVPPKTSLDEKKRRSLFSACARDDETGAADQIPAALDTPAFRSSWAMWQQHRREKRQRLTPTATRQQLTNLKEMGHDRAIAAIEHSIANGYTGIFEPGRTSGIGANGNGRKGGEGRRGKATMERGERRAGHFAEPPSSEGLRFLNADSNGAARSCNA